MTTLPKYNDLFQPILQQLSSVGSATGAQLEVALSIQLGITEEDLALEYESGNGRVFRDRISWALSYLFNSKLVSRPKRGTYLITDEGKSLLSQGADLKSIVAERIKARAAQQARQTQHEEQDASDATPQEELYRTALQIRQGVEQDILDAVLSKSATEFEHLVVKLLQAMGYGGEVKDAGLVTPQSNDGGIDGIIREDVLGLGRIHIQAKRYSPGNTVSREEIQKFVGALAVAQSNKGVFITTSSYSSAADQYAASLHGNTSLVLIDGPRLAQYIYDYGLGMQVEETIVIKKLDHDYWDPLEGNP